MTLSYIRWRDASHGIGEFAPSDMGLVELAEVGWLVQEDDESVTLSMEYQADTDTRRLWLTIPKGNIEERRDAELDRAFPVRKRKR
jgi:hypothetical protein